MNRKAVQSASLGKQIAGQARKSHLVGVSLDIELYEKLKSMADGEDRDPSGLAKALLKWSLQALEKAGGYSKDFLEGKWVPKEPEE